MKKIIYIGFCCAILMPIESFGQQVIIGAKNQSVSKNALLEFPDNDTRGMVLPKVKSTDLGSSVDGTLIFDRVDNKVKFRSNNQWEDLSINKGEANFNLETNLTEVAGARTLIGSTTSSADGVLVLESTKSALVLPRVKSPHLSIAQPPAGTIVYDTDKNLVCVYNGKEWAFWGLSD